MKYQTKKIRNQFVTMLLCACMLCGLTGCAGTDTSENGSDFAGENKVTEAPTPELKVSGELAVETAAPEEQRYETVNLMSDIEPEETVVADILPMIPVTRFGVPLFQNAVAEAKNGENVLISPLSAWTVLCMVESGAADNTKAQMGQVLGISGGEHMSYLLNLRKRMEEEQDCKVHLANGIWFKNVETLHVEEDFLKHNKALFDAAAYKAPFNEETKTDINNWVSENTDGMIQEILKEIKEEDVIYLVNALCFDAEWQKIYNETEVWKDCFVTEAGEEQLVPMMHSTESVYLEDEAATGFMKYYKGQKYAFVALLPKDGTTMADYVKSMTAEGLKSLFDSQNHVSVDVTMPKFAVEYGFSLNDSLKQMGMPEAFSEDDADFSKMATSDIGNIYVSRVNQQCFLAVDERGTKAGAATAVAMANKMAMIEKKMVNLNRPFVYMIVECEYNEPLFIGTMMDVEQ